MISIRAPIQILLNNLNFEHKSRQIIYHMISDNHHYQFEFRITHCTIHGIKFPCQYFVEIKTGNNKNVLAKSHQNVLIVDGVASFNESLRFVINLIKSEGTVRYVITHDCITNRRSVQTIDHKKERSMPAEIKHSPVEVLILLNLISTRRPDQVKLVGRYSFDLQQLISNPQSQSQRNIKLEYSSVDAHINLTPNLIHSSIKPFDLNEISINKDQSEIQSLLMNLDNEKSQMSRVQKSRQINLSDSKQNISKISDNIPSLQSKNQSPQNSQRYQNSKRNSPSVKQVQGQVQEQTNIATTRFQTVKQNVYQEKAPLQYEQRTSPKQKISHGQQRASFDCGQMQEQQNSRHKTNQSQFHKMVGQSMSRQRQVWNSQKSLLNQQINLQKQQKSKLQDSLQTTQKKLHDSELKIVNLNSKFETLDYQHSLQLRQKQNQIKKGKIQLQRLQQKIDDVQQQSNKQTAHLQLQLQNAQNQNTHLQSIINQHNQVTSQLQKTISSYEDRTTIDKRQIELIKLELQHYKNREEEQKKYTEGLEENILKNYEEKSEMQAQSVAQIKHLTTQLQQLKDYQANLEKSILEYHHEKQNLQHRNSELTDTIQQLHRQPTNKQYVEGLQEKIIEDYEKLSTIEKQLEVLQQQKKQVENQLELLKHSYLINEEEYKEKIRKIEEQLHNMGHDKILQQRVFQLEEEIMILKNKKTNRIEDEDLLILQGKLTEKEEQILQLENVLSQRNLKVEELQAIVEKLSHNQNSYDDEEIQINVIKVFSQSSRVKQDDSLIHDLDEVIDEQQPEVRVFQVKSENSGYDSHQVMQIDMMINNQNTNSGYPPSLNRHHTGQFDSPDKNQQQQKVNVGFMALFGGNQANEQQYQKDPKKLSQQVINLRSQLNKLRQQNQHLENQLQQYFDNNSQETTLKLLKQKETQFSETLIIIEEQSKNLVAILQEKQAVILDLQSKLENGDVSGLPPNNSVKVNRTSSLQQHISMNDHQLLQLNQRILELEQQLKESNEQLLVNKRLLTKMHQKEQHSQPTTTKDNNNLQEVMKLNARIQQLEQQMFSYQSEENYKDIRINELQQEIKTLTSIHTQLYQQLQGMKNGNKTGAADMESLSPLKSKVDRQEKELEDTYRTIQSLQQKVKNESEKNKRYRESVQQQVQLKNNELIEMRGLINANQGLQEKLQKLKVTLSEKEQELQWYMEQYNEQVTKNNILQGVISQFQQKDKILQHTNNNQQQHTKPPLLSLQSFKSRNSQFESSPTPQNNESLRQQLQQLREQLQFIKLSYDQTLQENVEMSRKVKELEVDKENIIAQWEEKQMENMNTELDLHIKLQEQQMNMKKSINGSNRSHRDSSLVPNNQNDLLTAATILREILSNNVGRLSSDVISNETQEVNGKIYNLLNSPTGKQQNQRKTAPRNNQLQEKNSPSQNTHYLFVSRIRFLEQQLTDQQSTISLQAIRAIMIEKSRMVSMQLSKSKTEVMRLKVQHSDRLLILQLLKPIDSAIKGLVESAENLGNQQLANIIQHYQRQSNEKNQNQAQQQVLTR